MNIYTLKVVEIRQETEDTKTLCFKQPGLKKIKYKAGQYLTLIFRINGRRYIRPYSFSSTPGVDDTLQVTVKRVQNGIVSNHINDLVKIGDSIEVMSPMGHFVYEENISVNQVYFWGTGSGITPLISLAKQILLESPMTGVNLIYGNRNTEQVIFSDLISSLQQLHPARFKVWQFFSQLSITEKPPYILEGRIRKEKISSIIDSESALHSLHYICGPLGLKKSVIEALSDLGVTDNRILFEDFEIVRDPKEFEDIKTEKVQINFNQVDYDIEVVKGKSILESALDSGIELPYSCQTGSCNTCLAKLSSGSVRMIGLANKRDDLKDNEYLLCCSHPLTTNVSLQI